jgi:UDP-N-acetylmuramoylalanine--D-glutamate ligase
VLAEAPPGATTFGLAAGHWRVEGDRLLMPDGTLLLDAGDLYRALPHDRANALAASAAALAAGATPDGIRAGLREFRGLPHRVALVGEHAGVSYYDDSKATAPHAALAAIRGFESVVLLAGGRNKGLDLSELAAEAGRLRAVIALGEAADDVERAFLLTGVPVVQAPSMDAAVALARDEARPGDVVLLSPGCASFDWYRNYGERGDDFARAVRAVLDAA